MTWVKVCGLTRDVDVAGAVDAGADAAGFVLAAGSPRRVTVEDAAKLMEDVPIRRVLVTVDASSDQIRHAVEATGADGIQPYGRHAGEVAEWGRQNGLLVLRPAGRITVDGFEDVDIPDGQIVFLDSGTRDHHGGTGVPLDWAGIRRPSRRFVLAGGLSGENVAEAISVLRPWGVDASSRLESEPGEKDPARVAAFVQEAKRA